MKHEKEKIRVLVDLDGVLRDFIGGLLLVYQKEYPEHRIPEITSRNLEDFFPIREKIYPFIDGKFLHAILENAPAYPGAIEALSRWERQFNSVIVTAQPPHWRYPTFTWIGKNKVPVNEIHINYNKHEVTGVALLDDFPDNLDKFAETGRLAVCMDKPWNRDWMGPRVNSVDEFYREVLNRIENNLLQRD